MHKEEKAYIFHMSNKAIHVLTPSTFSSRIISTKPCKYRF